MSSRKTSLFTCHHGSTHGCFWQCTFRMGFISWSYTFLSLLKCSGLFLWASTSCGCWYLLRLCLLYWSMGFLNLWVGWPMEVKWAQCNDPRNGYIYMMNKLKSKYFIYQWDFLVVIKYLERYLMLYRIFFEYLYTILLVYNFIY